MVVQITNILLIQEVECLFNGVALLIMAMNVVLGSVGKGSLAMVGLTALATLVKDGHVSVHLHHLRKDIN